jgi:hypothetical protein
MMQFQLQVCVRLGKSMPRGSVFAPITYATAGYIFHRFVHNMDGLMEYTHIILDEVHERSVENDLVFLIVKQLLARHKDLKVVLMSATPDVDVFNNYFAPPQGLAHVLSKYKWWRSYDNTTVINAHVPFNSRQTFV